MANQKQAAQAPYAVFQAAAKDNLEAVAQANSAAVAGAQKLNSEVSAYLNGVYEANLAASKAVFAAKTVQEAVDLQTDHVRASVDAALTKSAELSQVAASVANDVAQPLQARTKVALDALLAA